MAEEFGKMKSELKNLKVFLASSPSMHSPIFSDKASCDPQMQHEAEERSNKKANVVKKLRLDNEDDCFPIPPPLPLEHLKV